MSVVGMVGGRCLECERMNRKARGLCWSCYEKRRKAGTLDEYPVVGKAGVPVIPGVSYRQLDHWTREGYLRPDNPTPGSGRWRDWPEEELRIAAAMARLCAAGIPPATAERVVRDGPEIAPGIRVVIDA